MIHQRFGIYGYTGSRVNGLRMVAEYGAWRPPLARVRAPPYVREHRKKEGHRIAAEPFLDVYSNFCSLSVRASISSSSSSDTE